MQIEEEINTLLNSLVYSMSQGSHELFHSDVWAWLLRNDHSFVSAFFGDKYKGDDIKSDGIKREKGHRDITIELTNGKSLVIENKLKSLANEWQLKSYGEELITKSQFEGGIVTGIMAPYFADENGNINFGSNNIWHFTSYKEIGDGIARALESTASDLIISKKEIIIEYLEVLKAIQTIVLSRSNKTTLDYVWDTELDSLGLQDIINKIIASSFMEFFLKRAKEEGKVFDKEYFRYWVSFNNKKPSLFFRWSSSDKNNDHYILYGISIEGDEYRRTTELSHKDAKTKEEVVDRLGKDFFDLSFDPKVKDDGRKFISWPGDKPHRTKTTKSYCSYMTSAYSSVYQYFSLELEEITTPNIRSFESLYRRIIADMDYFKTIFDTQLRLL